MSEDKEPLFRRWLIDKLKRTRWARAEDTTREELAERLLVHPEALRLAQLELDKEREAMGLPMTRLGTHTPRGIRKRIEIAFPVDIHADWVSYCALRQVSSSLVLRSLVHTLLLTPHPPMWTGRGWWYRGRKRKMDGFSGVYRNKKWPHCEGTDITVGAFHALVKRATERGATPTGYLRGGVIELLEGRMHRLTIISSPEEMWDDPNKYWTVSVPREEK